MKRIISITFIMLPLCLFSQNDTVIGVNQHNSIVGSLYSSINGLNEEKTVLSDSIVSITKSYEKCLENTNKSHKNAIDSIKKSHKNIQRNLTDTIKAYKKHLKKIDKLHKNSLNDTIVSYEKRLKNTNESHKNAIDSIKKSHQDIQDNLMDSIYSIEKKYKKSLEINSSLHEKIDSIVISNKKLDERFNQMDLDIVHYKDTIAGYMSDISIKSKQIDSLSYIIQNQSCKFDVMTIEMIRTGLYTKCDTNKIASLRNDFANISDVKIKNDNKKFDYNLAIYTETLTGLKNIVENCYINTKGFNKIDQNKCILDCKKSIENLNYKKTYYLENYFTSPYLNAMIDNVNGYLDKIYNTNFNERGELIEELKDLKFNL